MPRQVSNDRGVLLDATNRGDAKARHKLVTLTVEEIARERIDTDLSRRKAEQATLEQHAAREQQARAEGKRRAAQIADANTLATGIQDRWEREHLVAGDDLARVVALANTLDPSRLAAQRAQEWLVVRVGLLMGEIGVPIRAGHAEKRQTLREVLRVPTTEAR